MSDPLVNLVHERVVNLTGVPKPNAEFFQVPARGIAVAVAVTAAAAAAAASSGGSGSSTSNNHDTVYCHMLCTCTCAAHTLQVLRHEPGQFYKAPY